jgi:hypothetical protein
MDQSQRVYNFPSEKSSTSKICGLVLAALISALLNACQPSSSERAPTSNKAQPTGSSTATPQMPAPKVSSSEILNARIKKGMAYADLRKIAIGEGWSPVIDQECKTNVIGGNHEELCALHPDLDDCRVCGDLPELGSCSGDGYCGMTFSKGRKIFDVTTYGMIEDRAVTGQDSRLQVVGWEFTEEAPSKKM